MGNLEGSSTEQNLRRAFAAESEAAGRFSYYAQKAEAEGYPDIAALFRALAEGETNHAFGHLDFLADLPDPVTGMAGGTTEDHLKAAIEHETLDYTRVYPAYADTARQEGFAEVADWFETVARAERGHAARLTAGLESLT